MKMLISIYVNICMYMYFVPNVNNESWCVQLVKEVDVWKNLEGLGIHFYSMVLAHFIHSTLLL